MLLGGRFAAFGLLVCLATTTCACSSRSTAAGVPATPPVPADPASVTAAELPPTAPRATTVESEADPDGCALIEAPGEPIATVALAERIDPSNAPRPSNASELLLFRQLYETLVKADCRERVVPGLAASWRLAEDGRTWIFTLRDAARFSDGSPVTAADIRASWLRDSGGGALHPHVSRLVESIVPIDDRTLAIRLRSPRVDMPLALAHPDLAIAKSSVESRWPLGTRGTRIAPSADTVPPMRASMITLTRDDLPGVRFLIALGDPRDLLDRGVDLMLTRDPAALDYAATLQQFESIPLAWQRTHVLLTPGRTRASPPLSEDARQVLADDAVRGEARGARGPFWWETSAGCGIALPPARNESSPIPRIVYDATDGVARDLAERFVGLARAPGAGATAWIDVLLPDRPRRTFQRAAGLTGDALAVARRRGADAGYIVSVDSRPIDPCRDLLALLDTAQWLAPETIVPLVETRLQAIVRRGRSGVTAEWDGGLAISGMNGSGKR